MGSANERKRYYVTPSLIGRAHTQNDPWSLRLESIMTFLHVQWMWVISINTLRVRQNGRHFADDIFKCILLNENVWITIKNSLKFVPKVPINNIPALVQIMAWRRPGDKPLSEAMLVSLPMHICVTRPQWVNLLHAELLWGNIFSIIYENWDGTGSGDPASWKTKILFILPLIAANAIIYIFALWSFFNKPQCISR